MKRRRALGALLLVTTIVVLLVAPHFAGSAGQSLMAKMLTAAVFACGYNLLMGQAGLLAFGHATFYGLGAIMTLHAMSAVEHGTVDLATPLLPLVGLFVGFVSAAVIGLFATKRSGAYFALVTFAIAELVHVIAPMWQSLFGGESGITSTRSSWLSLTFASDLEVYYLVLGWSGVSIGALWLLTRTAFGRLTLAVRENENRLQFLGYNAYLLKVLIFAISGGVAGLAGSLFAMTNEAANYTLFSPEISAQVIFNVFIGGSTTFLGPIVAAALLTAFPYWLSDITRSWPLYQGLIFMGIMLYMPDGIGGWIRQKSRKMAAAWRSKAEVRSIAAEKGASVGLTNS